MTRASQPRAQSPSARRAVPTLDLAAPRTLGLAAATALIVLFGAAALVTLPAGPVTLASGRVHADPVAVRHADGGVIARLHVKDGSEVEAGTVLATLDARLLDSQIAGLKRQMDGIKLHVSGLKQEAEALAATDRGASQRQRLGGLEAQITSSEQEGLGLEVRLAMAEQEKARTQLKATTAGRIVRLAVAEGGILPPQGLLALVQPPSDRLVLDTVWPAARVGAIALGQAIALRPAHTIPWTTTLAGRVDQVVPLDPAPGAPTRVRLRIVADLAGSSLTEVASTGDRFFTVHLVTASVPLLSHLLSPFVVTNAQVVESKATP